MNGVKGWMPGPFDFGSSHQSIVAEIDGQQLVVATVGDMPCIGGHDDMAAQRGCDMEHRIAHLLKAAPDLYEALEIARDYAAYAQAEPADLALIDAALARATGETP